jgi:hypothetical protein
MSARIYAMALIADRRICVDGNVREFRDMTKGVLSTSDNGHYVNLAGRGRTGFPVMSTNED